MPISIVVINLPTDDIMKLTCPMTANFLQVF